MKKENSLEIFVFSALLGNTITQYISLKKKKKRNRTTCVMYAYYMYANELFLLAKLLDISLIIILNNKKKSQF